LTPGIIFQNICLAPTDILADSFERELLWTSHTIVIAKNNKQKNSVFMGRPK